METLSALIHGIRGPLTGLLAVGGLQVGAVSAKLLKKKEILLLHHWAMFDLLGNREDVG